MIDWPLLLVMVIVVREGGGHKDYKRYDNLSRVAGWVARRINKKLAGYEAMKKCAHRLHYQYGHCPDGMMAGIDEGACRIMQSAEEAEADYEADHR
jgi:hypothetical protein